MLRLRAGSSKSRHLAAFTLVEAIVASAVAVFVLFGVCAGLLMVLTRAAQQRGDAALESANQRCMAAMSKSLKEGKRVLIYTDFDNVEAGNNPVIYGNALAIQNSDDTVSVWALQDGAIVQYHKWFGVDPRATEFSRYQATMVSGAQPRLGDPTTRRRWLFSLADGIPQARWSTSTTRGEVLEGRVASGLTRMR